MSSDFPSRSPAVGLKAASGSCRDLGKIRDALLQASGAKRVSLAPQLARHLFGHDPEPGSLLLGVEMKLDPALDPSGWEVWVYEESQPPRARGTRCSVKGRVVMIVDDNPSLRERSAEALARADYFVIAVSDGRQALRCIEHDGRPDVILLDVAAPDLLGLEFLAHRAGSERLLGIPVVATSTSRVYLTPDIVAHVPKPFQLDHLIRVVRALAVP